MISALFALLWSFQSGLPATTLTVQVEGVPDSKGNVFVGVYRQEDSWPTFGKQYQGKIVKAVKGKNTVHFNLTPGEYAVAVYHDVNSNQILDKNVLGMPLEIYGFSNNARSTFSAPSFTEAKFEMKASKTISITVK